MVQFRPAAVCLFVDARVVSEKEKQLAETLLTVKATLRKSDPVDSCETDQNKGPRRFRSRRRGVSVTPPIAVILSFSSHYAFYTNFLAFVLPFMQASFSTIYA